jgi:hypothetical protein
MNIVPVVVDQISDYQLRLYYWNYLESGVVTVTSENPSYPAYRLYDRAQGMLFKGNSNPNPFQIKIDLGASGPYGKVDTIILGKNHNLAGLSLTLAYSSNDVNYTTAKSWQATAGINRQTFPGVGRRYWRLSIAAPASPPEIGELFLTYAVAFERNPDWGYERGRFKNINRLEASSGYTQKTKLGDMRKRRSYRLTKMDPYQRNQIETFETVTDSIRNFYVEDLEGDLFFAELPEPLPDFEAEPMDRWGLDFRVQEALE